MVFQINNINDNICKCFSSDCYYFHRHVIYSNVLTKSSFTMFFHFSDVTYSPNVLFMEENADSTIQCIPYFVVVAVSVVAVLEGLASCYH